MAESPLKRRGIPVEVETIEPAELDLGLYNLDDEFLERTARSLGTIPMSAHDIIESPFRIRAFDGIDAAFLVSRAQGAVVVTIVRLWPTPERDRMRQLLKAADFGATVRGLTGL